MNLAAIPSLPDHELQTLVEMAYKNNQPELRSLMGERILRQRRGAWSL